MSDEQKIVIHIDDDSSESDEVTQPLTSDVPAPTPANAVVEASAEVHAPPSPAPASTPQRAPLEPKIVVQEHDPDAPAIVVHEHDPDGPTVIVDEDVDEEKGTEMKPIPSSENHYLSVDKAQSEVDPDDEDIQRSLRYNESRGKQQTHQQAQSYMYRVVVCCIAVALIWTTSWSVAIAFTRAFIKIPPSEVVEEAINNMITTISAEKSAYSACVPRQLSFCNESFMAVLVAEQTKVDVGSQNNAETVFHVRSLQKNCSASLVAAVDSIQQHQSVGGSIVYDGVCTADEVEELQQLYGDISSARSAAYLIASDYAAKTEAIVAEAAESGKNRSDYDDAYVANKAAEIARYGDDVIGVAPRHKATFASILDRLDTLVRNEVTGINFAACALPITDPACPGYTPMQEIELELQYLELEVSLKYNSLKRYAEINRNLFLSYYDKMLAKMNEIKSVFDFLRDRADDLSTIGISVTGFPGTYISPPNPIALPPDSWQFRATPNLDRIVGNITSALAALRDSALGRITPEVSGTQAQVNSVANNWEADVIAVPRPSNSDYNPPPIVVKEETTKKLGDSFKKDMATTLNTFGETDIDLAVEGPNIVRPDTTSIGLLEGGSDFSFSFAQLSGDIEFTWLFFVIDNFVNLSSLLDWIYRAYRTYRVIHKFLRRSYVIVKPIDVSDKNAMPGSESSPVRTIMSILGHPLFGVAVAAIMFIILMVVLLTVYIAFFVNYVEGCVQSSDGTLLTNNGNAIAYNYAAQDGNLQLLFGMKEYDRTRARECGQYLERSTTDQQRQEQAVQSSKDTHAASARRVLLLEKCVVPAASFPSTPEEYLNATNRTRPDIIIAEADECREDTSNETITDATFNCTLLPKCIVTCNGPDAEIIRAQTYNAGCYTEYLIHAGVLTVAAALLTFACINLSRLAVMKSICLFFWKPLTHGDFLYVGTCTLLGNTKSTQRLKQEIEKRSGWYTFQAVSYGLAALLAHVPYVVVFWYVSKNLVYKS